MILDPTDQTIRDEGFRFVPFNRFLASPFVPPNISFDTNTGEGVMSVLPRRMSGGGGGAGGGNIQDDIGKNNPAFLSDNFRTFDLAGRYTDTVPATLQGDYDVLGNKIEEFTPQNPFSRAIDLGRTVGSGVISAVTGIPFAGPLIESGIGKFKGMFPERQLGSAVIDEFGNVYDEEELNRQNALGGFYSEAARSARRRKSRIENMLERQKLGKTISIKNLRELQAQEKKQEAIDQAAFDAAMAMGAGFYDTLREGRGASVSRTSREEAGSGFSDASESGPFADGGRVGYMMGGLTDLVDIYD